MISSLVSFAKRSIHEEIPGMQCASYELDASKDGIPSILYVEDSFYYKPDIDGNQDMIKVSSKDIVLSLVHMHITSQLAYVPNQQHPALMAFPEEKVTAESLKSNEKQRITVADNLLKQRKWFLALVRMADDDWQQYQRHNMISDIQRTAARELGLKRDWLMTIEDESTIASCPFCGSNLMNPTAPICPVCGKVHNPAKMKELESKFNPNPTVNTQVSK